MWKSSKLGRLRQNTTHTWGERKVPGGESLSTVLEMGTGPVRRVLLTEEE
ncbi:MAG: hypothetical protein ACYCT9_13180 [Leptospirillum sp.]